MAFSPLYASFVVQNRTAELRRWAERLLKALAAGGMVVVLGAALVGHRLVPLGLGEGYSPVVANLQVLSLALVMESLSQVGYVLSMAYELPEVALESEMVRLAAFWTAGVPLVTWLGSLGGCVAVLMASAMYATYVTWRLTRAIRYSVREWIAVIALGMPFLPLAWLRASLAVEAVVYGGIVTAYVGLLLACRVFTRTELVRLWQALVARESASPVKGQAVVGS
jgi:O-antigen/teichoic acid export membrane protein